MPFEVIVDDNFHYMDEAERYVLGSFETFEAALDAAKRIVDEYLASAYRPGITVEELYESYTSFGEDPFIKTSEVQAGAGAFSAWRYARERCAILCGADTTRK